MEQTVYSQNDFRNYELYHHGILGQKWGVRRYQKADGTLTDEGRKRRQQIINQTEASKKVGKVVGGAIGGAAGVGASAAITLKSGFIIPHLQVGITAGAVAGGAKAFESALQKIGDKRLADFDKKVSEGKFIDKAAEPGDIQKNAVGKANKAKTDEEHDKLNREADEKYAKAAAETRQYYKDNKDRLLKNAKEKDQYDMEFLERSDPFSQWDNKRYISEYEKYLDDPYSYQPYEYRKNK